MELNAAGRTTPPIYFTDDDIPPCPNIFDDAVVISAVINRFEVTRILIGSGSSANILYLHAAERMGLNINNFKPVEDPLVDSFGTRVMPEGTVTLEVLLGPMDAYEARQVDFFIVRAPTPYNCIFGRPFLNLFKAIVSPLHMAMKFPTMTGVVTVRGDMMEAQKCRLELDGAVFLGRGTISEAVPNEEAIKIAADELKPFKKLRINSRCEAIPQVKEEDCKNNDCYETDLVDYTRKVTSSSSNVDNVTILSEKEPVSLRDFPHPRHLCGNFPFSRTTHESYCSQCFCSVCEVAAPCSEWWGSNGHCNISRK